MKKAITLMLATLGLVTSGQAQSSDILSQAGFGYAVAVSGNYVFVGEPLNNRLPGRVYIFSKDPQTGGWSESGVLHPEKDSVGNRFGTAVAASGGFVAVTGIDTIYIFSIDAAGDWKEEASLVSNDTSTSFGESLAMDHGRLFATSRIDGRAVTVKTYEPGADAKWSRTGSLELPIKAVEDIQVAIAAGDNLLLAAKLESGEGLVYLFEQADGKLIVVDSLSRRISSLGSGDSADADFGAAIAYHDGSLLIGAPGNRQWSGRRLGACGRGFRRFGRTDGRNP